ncbi:MAG: DUF104 domain-containing protein [Candidatus Omnitrophota bacterium]|jgi:predicted DNA-binding antitoxin AbrB/MazE fold protein|nr:MAG: DUF104 domain-containing protein [Candidatus Omnitrophota bacterium]
MGKSLKVIYENGVLRPLEPVPFREHQQVTLMVLEKQETSHEGKMESCFDIAMRTGLIGSAEDAPHDLSTNPKYFE